MRLTLQIALGIVLAAVILSFGSFMAASGFLWWGTTQVEEAVEEQQARQAERARLAAEAKRIEAQRQNQLALQQQKVEQERRARQQELAARERAFENQYRPPRHCKNPQSNTTWVECVDLRRKAKSEFMDQQAMLSNSHEDIRIGD